LEEKQPTMPHKLTLCDRQSGTVTGVADVVSFDTNEIVLVTSAGLLTLKGKDLHVLRLNLEKQEVDLGGKIDSMIYTEGGAYGQKTGETLLKRLFK
jgi:sporulation protein YabP